MKTVDDILRGKERVFEARSSSTIAPCSCCGSRRIFTPLNELRALERRRYPRGKLECEFSNQRWHWNLEQLQREISLTRDIETRRIFSAEFEDILMQHTKHPHQLEEQAA
jgi:hypothetical protein